MEVLPMSLRGKIKRFHSIDRQKTYVTPSKRDVRCPYFDDTFLRTGAADVADTFCAVCKDEEGKSPCDYRENILDLKLCKRYWLDPVFDVELKEKDPSSDPAVWQQGEVDFEYERMFIDRTANVEMVMTTLVNNNLPFGSFLKEWKQVSLKESGTWQQVYNAVEKRDEVVNRANQNGISFWQNPLHQMVRNYRFSFKVQVRGSDDDTIGAVFRYTIHNFYTIEWDSGGMGHNGFSIYRYHSPDLKTYTKTRMGGHPVQWGAGSSYIHRVSVSINERTVEAVIERQNGANWLEVGRVSFVDNDWTAPPYGSFGPLTESQPNTYFWDFQFGALQEYTLLPHDDREKVIPLEYTHKNGSLFVVSSPLREYFTKEMEQEIMAHNKLDPDAVVSVSYRIKYSNVAEGVLFTGNNLLSNMTVDKNNSIAMKTFNYGKDTPPFNGYLMATDRGVSYQVSDTSKVDRHLMRAIFRPQERRYFDEAQIKVNGVTIHYIPNIVGAEIVYELPEGLQLEMGDTVSLEYNSNIFEMEYYKGKSVDTHDKRFKIEGNVLHWHHIPSYEVEN